MFFSVNFTSMKLIHPSYNVMKAISHLKNNRAIQHSSSMQLRRKLKKWAVLPPKFNCLFISFLVELME